MGIESFGNIEGFSKSVENTSSAIEISDSQLSYLKELDVPSDKWENMSSAQQDMVLSRINDRFAEMDIDDKNIMADAVSRSFSPEIVESYFNKIEHAPHDIEQIELVSDVLSDMQELKFENWEQLSLDERIDVVNKLETRVAEIECRPSCPIYIEDMGSISIEDGNVYGRLGGFNPDTKDITLNVEMLKSNDPAALRETLDTIIHEGRHAYQDYNVNECEVHSRHSEVLSWAETMEGGKWGYCGGSSSLLGQRLYEQQSVEIDARNFALDVLDKYEDKLFA